MTSPRDIIACRRLPAKVKFLLRSEETVDKMKEIVYNKSYLADVGPVLVEDFQEIRSENSVCNHGIIRETEVCKHYAEDISA